MRILQVNVTANWGSTGKIAEQIGLKAIEHGWDSYIAYSRQTNGSKSNLVKIGNKIGLYFHVLLSRLFDMAGLGAYLATKRLIREIMSIKPDIVHIHNIHGYVLNYKLLFKYLNTTNINIVWTFHDFWAITGHCCHFISAECYKWQSMCDKCALYREYPSSYIDCSKRNFKIKKNLFASNQNLTIVAVSDWVADIAKRSFLGDKRIETIYNGVDTSVFKPIDITNFDQECQFVDKFMILGVATQWKSGKGLDDFIVLSTMLKHDEIIVLVGLDEQCKPSLPSNIVAIDRTSNQSDLANIYNRADVLVSFSSAETFGMTIIEAMACGTPAIVYNNTAPPALITSGTGIVVTDKNVKAAYDAIQEVKCNGKKFYSAKCINHIRDYYDKDKCFNKYIELYNRLLNIN